VFVQTEFTVHLAGLSANSIGLSAKLIGWEFYCSNFELNGFRSVFTEFGRFFQKSAGSEGAQFFKHWSHAFKIPSQPGDTDTSSICVSG
jgi:hypothetical protein